MASHLIAETVVTIDVAADDRSLIAAAARKVARLLGDFETYVSGQSDIIIDYATARRCEEPISTAITESTVQWLLHRRMNAQQQMRWSLRGVLKVRTSVVNVTFDRDYAVAGRWPPARFGERPDPRSGRFQGHRAGAMLEALRDDDHAMV